MVLTVFSTQHNPSLASDDSSHASDSTHSSHSSTSPPSLDSSSDDDTVDTSHSSSMASDAHPAPNPLAPHQHSSTPRRLPALRSRLNQAWQNFFSNALQPPVVAPRKPAKTPIPTAPPPTIHTVPNLPSGDFFDRPSAHSFRIWSNNINGLSHYDDFATLHELCMTLKDHDVDAIALQESNVDFTQPAVRDLIKLIFKEHSPPPPAFRLLPPGNQAGSSLPSSAHGLTMSSAQNLMTSAAGARLRFVALTIPLSQSSMRTIVSKTTSRMQAKLLFSPNNGASSVSPVFSPPTPKRNSSPTSTATSNNAVVTQNTYACSVTSMNVSGTTRT
jgi:hypothetical protein